MSEPRSSDIPADLRDGLLEHLATSVTPARWSRMRAVAAARTRRLVLVLEELYQEHNASAILRTCDGYGLQEVHAIEGRNRFRPNEEISLGASQWVSVHRHVADPGAPEAARRACVAALRARGYRVAATSLRPGAVPLDELPLDRPLALCFGTEMKGLSETLLAEADLAVVIPMLGFTQSFNVSVSAAICLHSICSRLRREGLAEPLPALEQRDLLLDWLLSTRDSSPDQAARWLAAHGHPAGGGAA